ncbi:MULTISPECIES: hypothetical protein [Microvirga]|uniref:hypothetical protein n=1 Tax=Microvirga TaxID=186650 RepID=UPI0021C6CE95|nr:MULTISPECIES: hypothetical protein [unclassified Microvirga]
MPTVRMRNQAKGGMTFWGFLTVMALVIGLGSAFGLGSAYAETPPGQPPQMGTTEWFQQKFNENSQALLSKGKQLKDFVDAYGSCVMSGSSDCSADKITNQLMMTNLQNELASSGSWVREVVSKLDASCWSCETYSAIFGALMGLAGETFSFFVETREIVALAVVVTQIILVIKVFLIISAPAAQDFNSAYGDVFKYIGRVAVIFLLFLTPLTAQAFKTNTGSGSEHPAKVLFVDGPLLLGTQVGKMLVDETGQITKAKLQDRTCADPTTGSGSLSDMAREHLKIACKMLWSFHSMGVAGIASGTWLITEAPRSMNNPSWGALGAVIVAGLVMTVAFLFFTITFGLRYLDALVRAGLTLALLPVFLFFWIFQSTRSIAHAGLRSLLYMGAVFAASGFVFVICNEIMNFGFSKALGSSVTADGSQAFLNAMSQGGFNWFVGTGSGGDEANWLSFFYLMGAWGLATKAASIVFQLAEEITQFQGGLTGAGKETEADLKDKASSGMSIAGGGAKLMGSGAMSLGSGAVRMMR